MQVKGVSEEMLVKIADRMNFKLFNVRKRGNFVAFVIRMQQTSKENPEARYRKRGFSGRRTGAVCFHGHWRFFESIFRHNPKALIVTCKRRWTSFEDLERHAYEVGWQHAGSEFNHQTYNQQCDC